MKGHILPYFLLLFVFLNQGCKHGGGVNPDNTSGCYDFSPLPQPNFGFNYMFSPVLTGEIPFFNPSNNNEIIYRHRDGSSVKLYTYNIATRDSFCIGANNFNSWPKWNMKGWLVMTGYNNKLCKIKSDGTQLSFLTASGSQFPDWSPDGKKIVFCAFGDSANKGLCIINDDGSDPAILDSTFNADVSAWSPDGSKIAYHERFYKDSDFNYISMIDISTKKITRILKLPTGFVAKNLSWFPDSKTLLYETQQGLFTFNLVNHANLLLKRNCSSRLYSFASVSADGKTILCEREDDTQDTKIHSNVHCKTGACLMNVDGTNERIIDLK